MTTGTLGVQGEHDWLKVTLAADQAYLFTVTGLSNFATILVGTASDLSGNGVALQAADYPPGTPATQTVWFTPATAGTYYIDISDPSQTGTYDVTAVTEANDFPDTPATTGVVTVGGPAATGTLGVAGEQDWQSVTLTGGQAYLFTITGLTDLATILVGSAAALTSNFAYEVTSSGTGTATTQTVWFTPATTGTYYVDIADAATIGGYSVSAVTEPNDFPQAPSTTGTVTVDGGASTGTLGVAGEHDWMRLTLAANQAYLITVTGLSSSATIVVGPEGTPGVGIVAFQTPINPIDQPATQTVWITPPTGGTYYIDISDPATIGGYSVTAVTQPNDFPDTTATTGVVTVNGASTDGMLGVAGEHDWMRLSLTANQAYLITVTGLSSFATISLGSAADLATTLAFQTPQFPSNTTATQTLWFTPNATATYYVDITDFSTIGPYSVSATTEANDHPDTTATTGVVTVNGSATAGTLGVTGEHDWLAVSLTANQAYVVTVTGLSTFANIRIGDATALSAGVATQTPNLPAGFPTTQTVWFTPAMSGTYYIDISDPSTTGTYSVTAVAEPNDFPDTTATTGVVEIACFAAGTRIATETGAVAVEALRVGDHVRVAGPDLLLPVTWIGRRDIDCLLHPEPEQVRPVRIAPDAFGAGQPSRPLLLSPDHAVLVEGGLIPIRRLINGASIVQMPVAHVSYFHIELERHAVVFAEGLAAESYLDTGNRGLFANAAGPLVLHPRLLDGSEQRRRAALSCAPWLDDPERVEAVWRSLAERATTCRGVAWNAVDTTKEPALCVMIGDRRMQPLHRHGDRWWFALPALTDARLLSRSMIPTALQPWLDDRRRLGVMVRRMILRGSARHCEIAIDDPCLIDGWWDVERGADGTPWRWTRGDAALPSLDEPTILELVLGETPPYPVSVVSESAAVRRAA